MWFGGTEGSHQWTTRIIIEGVDATMTQLTSHEEKGSVSSWPLVSNLQVLLLIPLGNWHWQFIQYLYQFIQSNPDRNNFSTYPLLSLLVQILKLSKHQLYEPLIPTGESSQRAIIFMIESLKEQVLSPVFTNSDITELVYEHMTIEPVIVQKYDEKDTCWSSQSENIEKIYNTLWSIKMWLGPSVKIGCNVATPEQVLMGDQYITLGGERRHHVSGRCKHTVT